MRESSYHDRRESSYHDRLVNERSKISNRMSRARPLRIFQAAARPLTLNVAIGPFLEYFVNVVRESYFHGDTKRLLVARCLVPPMLGAYHVRGFAPMFLDCIVPRSRCGRRRVPRYISSSLGNARVRAVPAAYCIVNGAEYA